MSNEDKNAEPTKNTTISWRPEPEFLGAFNDTVKKLGVSRTELAERAIKKGFAEAADEIRKEKLAESRKMVKKLSQKVALPQLGNAIPTSAIPWCPSPVLSYA